VGDADSEDALLRSVALQNAHSIQLARQRAEDELLRTREALRQSEERLKAALSAAGTATFRWNIDANTVEWAGNFGRLFGVDGEAATQPFETFIAAVHAGDRAAVLAQCQRCARDNTDLDIEFRVVWPDGSVHWIANKAKAFVGEGGRAAYLTGACADVTSRRAAEEALRESEERLRAMFNQAAVGIAVVGLDGYFLDMNRKFSDILGFSVDELHDRTFIEITHGEDVAETRAAVGRLLAGSIQDYVLEKRYIRKDGSVMWSLSTVTLLRNAAGEPERLIGVIEDITSRKQTEAALREESRILEILNQSGSTFAATLDLQALIQSVTDAATELSGARIGAFFYNTIEEHRGAFHLYTLSGAPREAFEQFGTPRATALLAPTLRGEAPIRCDDLTADARYRAMAPARPGGAPPVRSYLAVAVKSRSGEVIGGLFFGHRAPRVFTERAERLVVGVAAQAGVAIDNARLYAAAQRAAAERETLLDRERAARSAAERMSEVKDEFLATLSHELRTPLNAILGWSQVLRSGQREQADLQKGLATIERNARAQTQLIEDLLDMSRITSGKLRIDVQPIHPIAFIEAAVETVKPAADAKQITLEKRLDPDAGPIAGDPSRLQQVMWNVLSNAIKFTPKGGRVQIVLERVNFQIQISVADSGIGISAAFLPHLFERFRQGDASTTRSFGGLGLGLSIVKSLVELHGGTVAATSAGEGGGTTITVQLPLAVHHRSGPSGERFAAQTAPLVARDLVTAELAGVRVLVADDEADARDLIKRVLEDCGADVMTASSASEAIRLVALHRPDVLLSDIGMPEADGFELLRRVRALGTQHGGKVPAIALTAFARSEDRTRALRAGFVVHVSKPVDASELVATVASVAGRVV
jgi:PAS domain S-box-containing protein